jgi:hypothetical protein
MNQGSEVGGFGWLGIAESERDTPSRRIADLV